MTGEVADKPLRPYPNLPVVIDLEESIAALVRNEHDHGGMLKLRSDLDRYEQIIETTRPEVLVECGTRTGASARWFTGRGVEVITIDIAATEPEGGPSVRYVVGSSTDPAVAAAVAELVAGRRCMVSLDSDHSAPHVAAEIILYGPMVSKSCYLVVEDGLFGYGTEIREQHGMGGVDGTPLDAIVQCLYGNADWSRDFTVEQMTPISSNPAGYWVRQRCLDR